MLAASLFLAVATQVGAPFPDGVLQLPSLVAPEGQTVPFATSESKGTVFLFLNVECPIGNRYAPEIARIENAFGPKGIRFFRVYVEAPGGAKAIARHGKDFGLKMPALLDAKKALVDVLGVRVTPEAALLGSDGKLKYRGRIDDQNVEHGKVRPNYRRDLRLALNEYLAGKPIEVRHTSAIGCIIP